MNDADLPGTPEMRAYYEGLDGETLLTEYTSMVNDKTDVLRVGMAAMADGLAQHSDSDLRAQVREIYSRYRDIVDAEGKPYAREENPKELSAWRRKVAVARATGNLMLEYELVDGKRKELDRVRDRFGSLIDEISETLGIDIRGEREKISAQIDEEEQERWANAEKL